jgi:hypothetical protein
LGLCPDLALTQRLLFWKGGTGDLQDHEQITSKKLGVLNSLQVCLVNTVLKFKNAYQVPRNYAKAVRLDERNGNTKWQDVIELELQQINEYETFTDLGHHTLAKVSQEYKKIWC